MCSEKDFIERLVKGRGLKKNIKKYIINLFFTLKNRKIHIIHYDLTGLSEKVVYYIF